MCLVVVVAAASASSTSLTDFVIRPMVVTRISKKRGRKRQKTSESGDNSLTVNGIQINEQEAQTRAEDIQLLQQQHQPQHDDQQKQMTTTTTTTKHKVCLLL